MTTEQKDHIVDYLDGLKDIKGTAGLPIGAIIFPEDERDAIIATIGEAQIVGFEIHGYHPNVVLWHLLESLENGQIVALNVKEAIHPTLLRQIDLLYHNQMDADLPWGDTKQAGKIPEDAKLLLLISNEQENNDLTSYITSVCRI